MTNNTAHHSFVLLDPNQKIFSFSNGLQYEDKIFAIQKRIDKLLYMASLFHANLPNEKKECLIDSAIYNEYSKPEEKRHRWLYRRHTLEEAMLNKSDLYYVNWLLTKYFTEELIKTSDCGKILKEIYREMSNEEFEYSFASNSDDAKNTNSLSQLEKTILFRTDVISEIIVDDCIIIVGGNNRNTNTDSLEYEFFKSYEEKFSQDFPSHFLSEILFDPFDFIKKSEENLIPPSP